MAFGSDNTGQYSDRAATSFTIRTATEYNRDTNAPTWRTVHEQSNGPSVNERVSFAFKPVRARWVRVAVTGTNGSNVRIDELEIYGRKEPIPEKVLRAVKSTGESKPEQSESELLRYAFLAEEHAWAKTYGRADLSPRLVPYNGRVKNYPRHVGDDRLPLPPLSSAPELDGKLDDVCWKGASRGVVRVAWPYDFDLGPIIDHKVWTGWREDNLYVAIQTDRLLSSHLAVVSTRNWDGCGIVAVGKNRLTFNTYNEKGRIEKRTPIQGACDAERGRFEFRLPLSLFPACKHRGLRIGLGMGGKHTSAHGRPILLDFAPLAIAQAGACLDQTFHLRLSTPTSADPTTLRISAPDVSESVQLAPGESKTIAIPVEPGPIGPQRNVTVQTEEGGTYQLHMLRYDPLERTLTLMEDMVRRFAAKGMDVATAQSELKRFRNEQKRLQAAPPDRATERDVYYQARLAKRRLMMRDPDLAPIDRVLFVKRRPFEPSHNYSVLLDSRYRPGGAVCLMEVPQRDERLAPLEANVARLFESKGGIARNPMASFDLSKIYFAYRPSADGYYHIYEMNPDGSGVKKLTDGPFHDYWPCPLPDGDLAMISTRCKARYLCWRPQVAVLFRMKPDGSDIRPLSHSNLSEWAPSIMDDGRVIWTRSEYIDKGADFGHTLWALRPDGAKMELVFGNDIIQPNGYANGREVPGTNEVCCTLISHFGDLNGPIALLDIDKGRFNPKAIRSITPEVPWPGMWPKEECFRDPVPVSRDYVLCSHAPRDVFGIYVIDRHGNREVVHLDLGMSSVCPTPFQPRQTPPVLADATHATKEERAEIILVDVYEGISPPVERGRVKYIRVVEEVRANLEQMPDGTYRDDHPDFIKWYAAPIDKVHGPCGWPSYVAKAPHGIVPVEEDGSARFTVPAGKTLYFQALDENLTELQRMRSVLQTQSGETRSCIGCHEGRHVAPPTNCRVMAMTQSAKTPQVASWGGVPLSYEKVVQPVLDAKCVRCHDGSHKRGLDLRGVLDADKIPASYKTLIRKGLVHFADYGWNSGGCEKFPPLTLGSIRSKVVQVLEAGHKDVKLTRDEMRRLKTWIDLNCPLWPDYIFRPNRPGGPKQLTRAD